MPAGLQVTNTLGTTVVDDTSPTLQLRKKVDVVLTTSNPSFDITDCDTPLFAIRPLTDNRTVNVSWMTTPVAGTRRLWIMRNFTNPMAPGEPGWAPPPLPALPVRIYHFDRPDPSEGPAGGLRVYDSLSRCCFNSNNGKIAVLRQFIPNEFNDFNVDFGAGRIGAFGHFNPYRAYSYSEDEGIGTDDWYYGAGYVSGSTVRVRGLTHLVQGTRPATGEDDFTTSYGTPSGMFMVDVTGY